MLLLLFFLAFINTDLNNIFYSFSEPIYLTLMRKATQFWWNKQSGDVFQPDQKLQQNQKDPTKRFDLKKGCTAAGEMSPSLAKQWSYI